MRLPIWAVAGVMALSTMAAGAIGAAPSSPPGDQHGWQPAAGLTQIPLWPNGLAIARPESQGPESTRWGGGLVAGRHWTAVENVSRPTMTIYPAKGHNSGAAILVFPGGGYQIVAIDLEGTEVCGWATAVGITCAVLKYRVPQNWHPKDCRCQSEPNPFRPLQKDCSCERQPEPFLPLQDAQRAMSLLRAGAAKLAIDPHKIGVLGFSAGGHLVTAISNAAARSYAPVDAADRERARPDFAVALYPGHLWSGHDVDLYPFDPISADAPPTILVQAEDDPIDDVHNAVAYFLALRKAKVPAEMHLYAHGGHAFGLRPTAQPITRWPALVEHWLRTTGILAAEERPTSP